MRKPEDNYWYCGCGKRVVKRYEDGKGKEITLEEAKILKKKNKLCKGGEWCPRCNTYPKNIYDENYHDAMVEHGHKDIREE